MSDNSILEFMTHRPVLRTILNLIKNKPILELGCGEGSTNIIHQYAVANNINVTTLESDEAWLARYNYCQNDLHELVCIKDFNDWVPYLIDKNVNWGLAFIDQGSWESRKECLFYLKDKVDFIILHDSCYYPKNNIFGKCTLEPEINCCSFKRPEYCPCAQNIKNFKRTYNDVFVYSKEYTSPYGPPTLLGSNFFNISNINVDMSNIE
jgi:hypothetical protein